MGQQCSCIVGSEVESFTAGEVARVAVKRVQNKTPTCDFPAKGAVTQACSQEEHIEEDTHQHSACVTPDTSTKRRAAAPPSPCRASPPPPQHSPNNTRDSAQSAISHRYSDNSCPASPTPATPAQITPLPNNRRKSVVNKPAVLLAPSPEKPEGVFVPLSPTPPVQTDEVQLSECALSDQLAQEDCSGPFSHKPQLYQLAADLHTGNVVTEKQHISAASTCDLSRQSSVARASGGRVLQRHTSAGSYHDLWRKSPVGSEVPGNDNVDDELRSMHMAMEVAVAVGEEVSTDVLEAVASCRQNSPRMSAASYAAPNQMGTGGNVRGMYKSSSLGNRVSNGSQGLTHTSSLMRSSSSNSNTSSLMFSQAGSLRRNGSRNRDSNFSNISRPSPASLLMSSHTGSARMSHNSTSHPLESGPVAAFTNTLGTSPNSTDAAPVFPPPSPSYSLQKCATSPRLFTSPAHARRASDILDLRKTASLPRICDAPHSAELPVNPAASDIMTEEELQQAKAEEEERQRKAEQEWQRLLEEAASTKEDEKREGEIRGNSLNGLRTTSGRWVKGSAESSAFFATPPHSPLKSAGTATPFTAPDMLSLHRCDTLPIPRQASFALPLHKCATSPRSQTNAGHARRASDTTAFQKCPSSPHLTNTATAAQARRASITTAFQKCPSSPHTNTAAAAQARRASDTLAFLKFATSPRRASDYTPNTPPTHSSNSPPRTALSASTGSPKRPSSRRFSQSPLTASTYTESGTGSPATLTRWLSGSSRPSASPPANTPSALTRLLRRASSSPRTSGIFEFSTTPPSPKAVQQRQTNSFVRSPEEPRRNNSFIRSLFAKDKEKDVSSSQPLPEGLPRNNSFIKSLFAKDSSQHGSSSQHHTQPLPPTMSQSEGQQPFLLPLFARNSDYSAITQQQDMMSSAGYGGTHHLKSSTSPQVLFGGLMHQQGPASAPPALVKSASMAGRDYDEQIALQGFFSPRTVARVQQCNPLRGSPLDQVPEQHSPSLSSSSSAQELCDL